MSMFLKKVVQMLKKEKIPYTLVGGYAVVLHGAVRGTVDIDLLTSLTLKNLEKLEEAMKQLGLQSRLPIQAKDIYHFREEYIKNKNLVAWSFSNPTNPTEVVDVLITHDLKEFHSQVMKTKNLSIHVIRKDSLIQMKKSSGRPQDLEDIKALEKL